MEANTLLDDRMRSGRPDVRFGEMTVALAAAMPHLAVSGRQPAPTDIQALLDAVAFRDMEVEFEPRDRVLWCRFSCTGRPSFTPSLVRDIRAAQDVVRQSFAARRDGEPEPVRYMVWASRMPGVWSLGGDLDQIGDASCRKRVWQ